MKTALAVALLAAALSGCVQVGLPTTAEHGPSADYTTSASSSEAPPRPSPTSTPATHNSTQGVASPASNATNQSRPAEPPGPKPVWGPTTADIYPGIMLGPYGCTTNFIFTDPAYHHIYIGSAAHCFSQGDSGCTPLPTEALGSPVYFYGPDGNYIYWWTSDPNATKSRLPIEGKLVYNSWGYMRSANETDASACSQNDFALIEIPLEAQANVTPAFHGFGSVDAILPAIDVAAGTFVHVYGHTAYWMGQEELQEARGIVTNPTHAEWDYRSFGVTLNRPSIWGDSGSAVFTADGRAAGVLVSLATTSPDNPANAGLGVNGCAALEPALDYLQAHVKLRVTLAQP